MTETAVGQLCEVYPRRGRRSYQLVCETPGMDGFGLHPWGDGLVKLLEMIRFQMGFKGGFVPVNLVEKAFTVVGRIVTGIKT